MRLLVFDFYNYAFWQVVALSVSGEAARVNVISISLERIRNNRLYVRILAHKFCRVPERQTDEIAKDEYLTIAVRACAYANGGHSHAIRDYA